MTATAVCAVSIDPPLVLACIGSRSRTHGAVESSGFFAVNLLQAGATALADTFASGAEEKFDLVDCHEDATGAPVLEAVLGYCDCEVVDRVTAGDHTIFIGRVESAAASDDAADHLPLLHFRRSYATVAPQEDANGLAGVGSTGDG